MATLTNTSTSTKTKPNTSTSTNTKSSTSASEGTYYHYTDMASAKQILQTGVIKQSTDTVNDAIKCKGTYVTTLGTNKTRETIAKNNYDGNPRFFTSKIKEGKTEVAIEMKLPKDQVKDHSKHIGRDVHKYSGDINLGPLKEQGKLKVHVRQAGSDQYKTYK